MWLSYIAVAMIVLGALEAAGQSSDTPPTVEKGRTIFTDTTLFAESIVRRFLTTAESFPVPSERGVVVNTSIPYTLAPPLADLEEKYGKADRIEQRKAAPSGSAEGPPWDTSVHWYGDFGFCVAGASFPYSEGVGKVVWVLWHRKKEAQSHDPPPNKPQNGGPLGSAEPTAWRDAGLARRS